MNSKPLMVVAVIAGAMIVGGLLALRSSNRSAAQNLAIPEARPEAPPGALTQPAPVRPLDELVRACLPSVALVKGKVGHGAGFLLPGGVLATNAHVVSLEFEENIRVHFPSAKKGQQGPYRAKFIWADRKRDLAFLEVDADVEPLELAEDYTLRPGQEIIAIGSPGLGQDELLANAPTKGMMSNLTQLDKQPFYAMSISVNPGNSGGPVIDLQGQVLGMVTAKMRDKEGIAFAIPLEDLRNGYDHHVMAQGREAGSGMTAWIRACTVFERLIYLGEEYSFGMDAYSRAMDVATSRGGTPNDGLTAVSKEVDPHLKKANRILADDLEKNIVAVIRDKELNPNDRERIAALWTCCREMKGMIDNPSGTLDTYRLRKESLKARYRDLTAISWRPTKPAKKKS